MIAALLARRIFRFPATVYLVATFLGTYTVVSQSASFEYYDGELLMSGEIDSSTPDDLMRAVNSHPDVEWIIMQNVPGSKDDDANLKAARFVRQRALNTGVPENGLIASGGTDFFLAGVERVVERGACIGVHSWRDDDDPTPPTQLPRDHIAHKMFLTYFRELGVPEDFYWYTIKAAPASGMHYMPEAEIRKYGIATEFEGDGPWDLSVCESR